VKTDDDQLRRGEEMKIGTTELIVIIIIALVVFGPGKLPELGRMIGKAIGSIKHYSDPNTWEKAAAAQEAELRKEERESDNKAGAAQDEPAGAAANAGETADEAGHATAQGGASGNEAASTAAGEAASGIEAAGSVAAAADAALADVDGRTAGVSGDNTASDDGFPIKIDVSAEVSEEDARHFDEMEGKSIDEIASSLLKAGSKQEAPAAGQDEPVSKQEAPAAGQEAKDE
jgi:TatA/E family protein of Tat protein translocase